MKAVEFLKNVVESVGGQLGVDGDILSMYQKSATEYESEPWLSKSGYPFLLPTNKNIDRLQKINDEGEPELQYLPFNPIQEDDIQVRTEAFDKYVKQCHGILYSTMFELGTMMLILTKDDSVIKTKGAKLEKFLIATNKAETNGVKKLVDDKTLEKWKDICTNGVKEGNKLVGLHVKRQGDFGGVTYNSLTTLEFPLYEVLKSLDTNDDNKVNGVKLRNKDLILFQTIFEHILPELEEDFTYRIGSNHKEYPAFISLTRAYCQIIKPMKAMMKTLAPLSQNDLNIGEFEVNIEEKDLEKTLEKIDKEIKNIPLEKNLLESRFIERKEVKKREIVVEGEEEEIVRNDKYSSKPVKKVVREVEVIEEEEEENPRGKDFYAPEKRSNEDRRGRIDGRPYYVEGSFDRRGPTMSEIIDYAGSRPMRRDRIVSRTEVRNDYIRDYGSRTSNYEPYGTRRNLERISGYDDTPWREDDYIAKPRRITTGINSGFMGRSGYGR